MVTKCLRLASREAEPEIETKMHLVSQRNSLSQEKRNEVRRIEQGVELIRREVTAGG